MRRSHLALAMAVGLVTGACASTTQPRATTPVNIFGPYRGAEADAFVADLGPWAVRNGIEIRYTGSGNLASDLVERVEGADPPDIAIVPQPGLVAELARDGDVRPLSSSVRTAAERHYSGNALAIGQVDGVQVGFPFRVSAKGLVWYRPAELAALGLRPPATLGALERLVDAIQDQGRTPWCFGVEAQRATGWPATDWVENLVVREWGTEVYRDWIAGAVAFSDARIAQSFERFRALVTARGRIDGGVARTLATPVQRAFDPLFQDPPGCVLYQQASFAAGWFPSGERFGPDADVDYFVLPGIDTAPPPIELGTDIAVAFTDRADVSRVMGYLTSADAVRTWTRRGGFISPQRGTSLSAYEQLVDRTVVRDVRGAGPLVVDASDAMPPAIGTRLLLDQITRWLARSITYGELAATLDAART